MPSIASSAPPRADGAAGGWSDGESRAAARGLAGVAAILLAAIPVGAETVVPVPSGQPLELIEAFWDAGGGAPPVLRLRLLAPEIGATRSFAEVEPDFLHLCRALALPRLTADRADSLIVINLLDRLVPFGTSDPEATQYFEAFRAEGGDCVWEGL